jgi:hypothetical protein
MLKCFSNKEHNTEVQNQFRYWKVSKNQMTPISLPGIECFVQPSDWGHSLENGQVKSNADLTPFPLMISVN